LFGSTFSKVDWNILFLINRIKTIHSNYIIIYQI
jgi:hypothetical protein